MEEAAGRRKGKGEGDGREWREKKEESQMKKMKKELERVKDKPGKQIKSFDFNLCDKKSYWWILSHENNHQIYVLEISLIYERWIWIVGEVIWKFSLQNRREIEEISVRYENKLITPIPVLCNHYNSIPIGLYLINTAQCLANNTCSILAQNYGLEVIWREEIIVQKKELSNYFRQSWEL